MTGNDRVDKIIMTVDMNGGITKKDVMDMFNIKDTVVREILKR